jgi:hypothetical protein
MAARLDFGSWVWEWAECQSDDIKAHLENEIIGEGWLFRQPANEQVKILTGAPQRFVQSILKQIKAEAAIQLGFNPFH